MPTWTKGVLPGRRKQWRQAGRWNPVTAGARDDAPASAPAPVAASSWTSARPTGARAGSVIGQGRASAPGPAPQDEEETLEQETEQELPRLQEEEEEEEQEHDAPADEERRPGVYAYAQSESTGYDEPPPLSQKDKSKEREKEKEKESSEHEQEQDLPPRLPNSYAYAGTPSTAYDEGPQRASEPASAADPYEHEIPQFEREDPPAPAPSAADPYEQDVSFVPEDPGAARLGATRQDLERQVAGGDPLADEDPSSWAPLKERTPHHNRLVARIATVHEKEKGTHRGELLDVARGSARTLKRRWEWLEDLRDIDPEDDGELEDFVDSLPSQLSSQLADEPYQEVLAYLTRQHANLYVQLRRQNIPVSPDGTLDEDSPAIKDRKVGYDETEEAQAATLVHIDTAGKLRRNSEGNPPVDTSNSATHFSGGGVEIFVVGVDGDIHLHSHAIGQYHHSSLLAGGDVAMAGEMRVVKGKIEWLSDKSGHYVPSLDHLLQFLHRLKKDGVPMDFELRGFNVPKGRKYTAAELLDSSADTGEDAWTKLKTKLVLEGFAASKDDAAVLEAVEAAGWRRDADGSVVDATGTPVPDRELRRHLKRHFGFKSPRKVLRGESVAPGEDAKKPEDLGFRPTVRSSAELTPTPAPAAPPSPAATMTPLQQRTTTTTSSESEAVG
ncbi:MAG TPA: hypothetical protein VFS29_10900, partial [Motilibacteraceae bacterium]|nr:hypothetical protein [Motilibacteraceae bacterium]